jgi:hypothetical protein
MASSARSHRTCAPSPTSTPREEPWRNIRVDGSTISAKRTASVSARGVLLNIKMLDLTLVHVVSSMVVAFQCVANILACLPPQHDSSLHRSKQAAALCTDSHDPGGYQHVQLALCMSISGYLAARCACRDEERKRCARCASRGDCSQWPASGRLPRAVSCVGGAAPPPQPRAAVATTSSARRRVRGSRDSLNSAAPVCTLTLTHTHASQLRCLVARRRTHTTPSLRPARRLRSGVCALPCASRRRLSSLLFMGRPAVMGPPPL